MESQGNCSILSSMVAAPSTLQSLMGPTGGKHPPVHTTASPPKQEHASGGAYGILHSTLRTPGPCAEGKAPALGSGHAQLAPQAAPGEG